MFKAQNIDYHFFFLGAAFLLIETKSITELALVFGTTWLVNSIVIAGILIMILLANLYAAKAKKHNVHIYYLLLGLSLILNYLIGFGRVVNCGLAAKLLLSSIIAFLPLLFAGIIFALSFKKTKDAGTAFSSNLLGAMLGGFLEYLSLVYGIKNLCLIALAVYFLSYIFYFKKMPTPAQLLNGGPQ